MRINMRGKRKDSEFISNFIIQCVNKNISSTEEMLIEAKKQLSEIEQKIKEAENLKILRSKLIDVVENFNNESVKINIPEELPNKHICYFICKQLNNDSISIYSLYNKGFDTNDIIFSIKKLIEKKIITKNGNYLTKSTNYNNFIENETSK